MIGDRNVPISPISGPFDHGFKRVFPIAVRRVQVKTPLDIVGP